MPTVIIYWKITVVFCRVSLAYTNQRRLDIEAKKLQANLNVLTEQTNEWLKLIEGFNHALKVMIKILFKM